MTGGRGPRPHRTALTLAALPREWRCRFDPWGRLASVDRAFAASAGANAEALVGTRFYELLDPRARAEARRQVAALAATDPIGLFAERRGPERCLWELRGSFGADGSLSEIEAVGRRVGAERRKLETVPTAVPRRLAAATLEAASPVAAEERREDALAALAQLAEILLSGADDWMARVPEGFGRLGRSLAASRVYLFRLQPADKGSWLASQLLEWSGDGIEPQIDNPDLQDLDLTATGYGRWVDELLAGRAIAQPVASMPQSEQELLVAQEIRSLAVVPANVEDNLWGFLGVDDCVRERHWSASEVELLRTAARLVASAIARQRDHRALQASEQRYRVLVENVPGVVYLRGHGETNGILYLNDEVEALTGYGTHEYLSGRRSLPDLLHHDDARAVDEQVRAAVARRERYRLVYRIQHASGDWRWVEEHGQGVFDGGGTLLYLHGTMFDVSERKRVEQLLTQRSLYDPLTGLANRALFSDRVAQALHRQHRGRSSAVLSIDVDRFKMVNEGLGHGLGDQLLRTVAERLSSVTLPGDSVARLGGDEFAMLTEIASPEEAESRALQVSERLATPIELAGCELPGSVSIGIAVSRTADRDASELMRAADIALFRAKALGGGRQVVYQPAMRERAVERLELESRLRRAVERGELRLRFQPIVTLSSGRMTGFEALLRWQHPERGLLRPAAFLSALEELGLTVEVGRWVRAETCRLLAGWRLTQPDLFATVNLHASELTDVELADRVAEELARHDLPAESLSLELTEHQILREPEAAQATLGRLRGLGVGLLVDDFGTGYSSLSYLSSLPIDGLKLDRSFVRRLGEDHRGNEIVAAIASLARTLHLGTIAEGVETSSQLEALRELGYDAAQGYLLQPPLSRTRLAQLVRRQVR